MRIDQLLGYWVRYKDSGAPVEVFDRIVYSFQNERREALVRDPKHLALLMETRRYEVVGVEVAEPTPVSTDENQKPRRAKATAGRRTE